jgi:hypothetical protein
MLRFTKLLMLGCFGLVMLTGTALADENPQPVWDPADWNGQPWANDEATRHITLFMHSHDARKYCGAGDGVVWLDRSNGFFYESDTHRFHKAIAGRGGYFVCRLQAERAGAKPSPTEH